MDQIENIDYLIFKKIKIQIKTLQKNLNKYNELNILGGDWALHNLLYSIKDNIIYNVDLEGFFSYQTLTNFGNIDKINKWLNNIIDSIRLTYNVTAVRPGGCEIRYLIRP